MSAHTGRGDAQGAPPPGEPGYGVLPPSTHEVVDTLGELAVESQQHAADLLPRIEQQAARWREIRTQLRTLLTDAEEQVSRHDRLAAAVRAIASTAETSDVTLRGRALADAAIATLRAAGRDHQPIHYTDWYRLVDEAGHRIGGKDPAASFLTAIYRHPAIRPVGTRTGLYELAEDAP